MLDGLRQAVLALVLLVAFGVFAGYWGHLHPAADSIAAFRVHLLLALGALSLLALLLRGWRALGTAVLVVAATFWTSAAVLAPVASLSGGDIRLYSQNLRFTNEETAAVIGAVRAFEADVVLLQEVSATTRPVFEALAREFEVAEFCAFGGVGGVAILSKLPLAGDVLCAEGHGFLLVPMETSSGPMAFGSLHLPWPWPHRQAELSRKIAGLLAERDERMVIAGDFNMAPWGASVARIAAASGTSVVPGLRLSFRRAEVWPGLPLDHVLVPEGVQGRSELLGFFGSDHAAVGTVLSFKR